MTGPFAETPTIKTAQTFGYHIHMAGDYDTARRLCRDYCSENGACISLHRTDYIYSGGEEAGFVATIINYPRFPSSFERLTQMAFDVADRLMKGLGQGSYTIEPYGGISDRATTWISRRKGD